LRQKLWICELFGNKIPIVDIWYVNFASFFVFKDLCYVCQKIK